MVNHTCYDERLIHIIKPFKHTNAPLLTNAGVLILIGLEKAFALSVGASFLVLNLNIMRILNAADEFDTLVKSLHRLEDVAGVYHFGWFMWSWFE